MDGFIEESHESFGMLSFSRQQGGNNVLHGSDLKHNTVISMRLHHGVKRRGISNDWYHAKNLIAEVHMSQNQFSELITSMNMGDGVPVTLKTTEMDGRLESPEFSSFVEQSKNEFKEQTKLVNEDATELLKTMKELLSGSGTIKKSDREELLRKAEKVVMEVGSNMPYMEKCFHESMDKVVTDAKGTIEAFYQHRVVEAGIESLSNNSIAPKLIEE